MKSPLSILHLEDDPNDIVLVRHTLEDAGIACKTTCVKTQNDFLSALEYGGIDLILSDYSLPEFDGFSAAEIVRTKWPGIPVILVSGTRGEELAIDSLKSGATDYVLKERLARLAPAVRRAMQEVEERIERQRLAAQFVEAQKMEVIGHLAGGVAHDFNNILAVIMGYSHLIASHLAPGSPIRQYAEEIQLASDRAAGLTQQLLIFSRKQTVQPTVLELKDIVKDMGTLLRRLVDENIELSIVSQKETGRIHADAGYIGQLLMNLVVNARDAMPNGGKLVVATENVRLDKAGSGAQVGVIPRDYVMLSVSDTGTGMTDEVKSHLFETFFTTKPAGKGTGLGLTTCQTIVQQSGGWIDVQSQIGKGTSFKVYFPRVGEPLAVAARPTQTGPLPQGTETLLIVEDDLSVRHLAQKVLRDQGYEVLTATNGQDALRVVREHKRSPIRLAVTDVVMPTMGGKVMAEWLRTSHPDIRILFTSGYTNDAIVHNGVLETGVAFLSKPYTPAMLTRKVREMLDDEGVHHPETENGNAHRGGAAVDS